MGEMKNFIEGLKELEISTVSLEVDEKSKLIDIENVLSEVEKIGIKEIGNTYFEEINFIAKNGELVSMSGFY